MSITHSSYYSFIEAFANNALNFDSSKKFENFYRLLKKMQKWKTYNHTTIVEIYDIISSVGFSLALTNYTMYLRTQFDFT